MNNTSIGKDESSVSAKTMQIVRKTSYLGSTLPPRAVTQNPRKNTDISENVQTLQLPKMKELQSVEERIAELEGKAKTAEENR